MNLIARWLFGLSADEIRSLREQNITLHARLDKTAEERDEARSQLAKAHAELGKALKTMIDCEWVNNGRIPPFGLGPKLEPPPAVDFTPAAKRADEVRERNQQLMREMEIVPNRGMWESNGDA